MSNPTDEIQWKNRRVFSVFLWLLLFPYLLLVFVADEWWLRIPSAFIALNTVAALVVFHLPERGG